MPNYKGHLLGGFLIYCIIIAAGALYAQSTMLLLQYLLSTLAGSLFPDIDTKSKGQKLFYSFLLLLGLVLVVQRRYQLLAYCAIVGILPLVTRHRGLFHKTWFILLFVSGVALGLISLYPHAVSYITILVGFFLAGACSHLYLDLGVKGMMRW